jgi:electron transfer flavoprotein alpha subunit
VSGALVLAETRRGALLGITAQLVSSARAVCGDDVTVLVAGGNAAELAADLHVGPLARILAVPIAPPTYEADAVHAALKAVIRDLRPELVVMAHTNDKLGVGPAVAAASGLGFASDVASLHRDSVGRLVARRGLFGGKLEAELGFDGHDTTVVLMRAGAFVAAEGPTCVTPDILAIDVPSPGAIEHLAYEDPDTPDTDLERAEVLIAIGRGLEDPSEVAHLVDLAAGMGGALVASRPLIDNGWVSSSRQIGQSGVSVAPKVYLALGLSGAVEHLAGIQAAGTVIAVNHDPSAPIFGVADYGVVANVLDVAAELRKQLR